MKKQAYNHRTLDHEGETNQVDNLVKVVSPGKFKATKGRVTQIKKWFIFEDNNRVKQVCTQKNLIINNDGEQGKQRSRKCKNNNSNYALSVQRNKHTYNHNIFESNKTSRRKWRFNT